MNYRRIKYKRVNTFDIVDDESGETEEKENGLNDFFKSNQKLGDFDIDHSGENQRKSSKSSLLSLFGKIETNKLYSIEEDVKGNKNEDFFEKMKETKPEVKKEPIKLTQENDDEEEEESKPQNTVEEESIEFLFGDQGEEVMEKKKNPSFEFIKVKDYRKEYDKFHPFKNRKYDKNLSVRLHQELIDFYNFIKETPEERLVREFLIEKVKKIVKRVKDNADVRPFGSFPQKLMVPGSDIDIQVDIFTNSEEFISEDEKKPKAIEFLRVLESKLLENGFVGFELIEGARIPVLKFQDRMTQQHMDVSVSLTGSLVIQNIKTILHFRKKYPAFKYLALFLKIFVKQRNLGEVRFGGLSSYSISLMIISLLQNHSSVFNQSEKRLVNLGSLLLDFFGLYGQYFNYLNVAIDVKNQRYIKRLFVKDIAREDPFNFKLLLIDPNNAQNIVSGGSFKMFDIRKVFHNAFNLLLCIDSFPKDSAFLSRLIIIDTELLARAKQSKEIDEFTQSQNL